MINYGHYPIASSFLDDSSRIPSTFDIQSAQNSFLSIYMYSKKDIFFIKIVTFISDFLKSAIKS